MQKFTDDNSQACEIRKFLMSGHPGSNTMEEWQRSVREYGSAVVEIAVNILENESFAYAPASIYALRAFGLEAFCEGDYGEDERYRLRWPGTVDWITVTRHLG